MSKSGTKLNARTLVAGSTSGKLICLDEPLSFWGGFDLETGRISDKKHPQVNTLLSNKILAMPSGRGSSSASSVLAESIRNGVGPCGIALRESDPIIALGAIVAAELYKAVCPVVLLNDNDWSLLCSAKEATIEAHSHGQADLLISASIL